MKHSLFKKFGASFVALTLAFSCTSAVSAAGDTSEFQPKVTYSNGNYTFAKLSHPDKAVSTPDGIVDYLGGGNVGVTGENGATGQGDQGQSYAWSAASYGDWMYVGTCYAAMGNTLTLMDTTLGDKFDKEVMTAALKAMFNGTFFYGHEKEDGTADEDSDGILIKVNVKTGETKLLMSKSLNGKGPLFRNAMRYKDKLYFCGSVRNKGAKAGLPSIYCIDPKADDIKCVYTGITPQELGAAYKEGISTGIRGMTEFNGEFIASCVGVVGTFDSSSLLQPIGQLSNGDLLKMSKEEWKSQLNYLKVFIELLLSKYIEYPTQPITAAETDSDEAKVEEDTKEVDLTASEKVQKAIESASKRYSGAQTASAASNDNVETIKLTTEQINSLVKGLEDGSIKANSLNTELSADLFTIISGMDPMADSLNEKGSQDFVDQYADVYEYYNEFSSSLPDDVKKLFDILITATKKDNLIAFGKLLKYLSTAQRGFDMYVTSDGETFSTITTNGFNDPYNHGLRVFATGADWMAIGTANPFNGTQLWKMTSPVKTVEPTKPTEPEKPNPSEPEKPNPSDSEKPNITVTPSDSDKKDTTAVTTKTDDKKGTAKTGDSTDVTTSLIATIGSLALLVGCAYVLRKKKIGA